MISGVHLFFHSIADNILNFLFILVMAASSRVGACFCATTEVWSGRDGSGRGSADMVRGLPLPYLPSINPLIQLHVVNCSGAGVNGMRGGEGHVEEDLSRVGLERLTVIT